MHQEELHYNRLLRKYEDLRQLHESTLRERQAALYEALPELEKLDHRIAEESVSAGIQALEGDSSALAELENTIQTISEQKKKLLVAAGYPEDYPSIDYRCPICKDTGFIGQKMCLCFKQQLTLALSDDGSLLDRLENENFSTFSFSYYDDRTADAQLNITPLQNIRDVVNEAKKFVAEFDSSFQNLVIYGNTGVGKTFLTNCIAKELLDNAHHVVYLTAFRFFEAFSAQQGNRTNEDANTLYRYIFDCDLLIIDDLGTELSNSFTNSVLYTCINERLNTRKSTIISTNLSLDQINDRYSERIFSRIVNNYSFLKLFGKDIRMQKKLQENS